MEPGNPSAQKQPMSLAVTIGEQTLFEMANPLACMHAACLQQTACGSFVFMQLAAIVVMTAESAAQKLFLWQAQ